MSISNIANSELDAILASKDAEFPVKSECQSNGGQFFGVSMSHAYSDFSAADLLAFEVFFSILRVGNSKKLKWHLPIWLAPSSLKCLEGEKVETIDLLDALSRIFI